MQSGSDCGFKCLLVVEQLTVRGIGQLPIIHLGLNEASKPPLIWINLVKVEVYSANARRLVDMYADSVWLYKPASTGNLPEMTIFFAKDLLWRRQFEGTNKKGLCPSQVGVPEGNCLLNKLHIRIVHGNTLPDRKTQGAGYTPYPKRSGYSLLSLLQLDRFRRDLRLRPDRHMPARRAPVTGRDRFSRVASLADLLPIRRLMPPGSCAYRRVASTTRDRPHHWNAMPRQARRCSHAPPPPTVG